MMKVLGNELTDQEVRDIMKESGAGAAGIGYAEFCKLMGVGLKQSRSADDPEEEMRDAFGLFDHDRDGTISPKDMIRALAQFGVALTEREVDQVRSRPTRTPTQHDRPAPPKSHS